MVDVYVLIDKKTKVITPMWMGVCHVRKHCIEFKCLLSFDLKVTTVELFEASVVAFHPGYSYTHSFFTSTSTSRFLNSFPFSEHKHVCALSVGGTQ